MPYIFLFILNQACCSSSSVLLVCVHQQFYIWLFHPCLDTGAPASQKSCCVCVKSQHSVFRTNKCDKWICSTWCYSPLQSCLWPCGALTLFHQPFFLLWRVNVENYQISLPQKRHFEAVFSVSLRKQHGCHTLVVFSWMTAITWTPLSPGCEQTKAQRVSGGKLHIGFLCAMVPHWFNIHRHTEVGKRLYQSPDTFHALCPQILWLH